MLVTGKHAWRLLIQSQWVRRQKRLYCISPKQPFHLTYSIDSTFEERMRHRKKRTENHLLQPIFYLITWSTPSLSTPAFKRIWCEAVPAQTMGILKNCGSTIHLHKVIKHFSCDKTQRERRRRIEREREQIKVLLQHIQIYPGDVFPNMQDLFMSVSISASHLQTESAASTPQHSQAYNNACHIHRGDSRIVQEAAATF